jgi:hypothetical protein
MGEVFRDSHNATIFLRDLVMDSVFNGEPRDKSGGLS